MLPEYLQFLQRLQERNEVLTIMALVGVLHPVAYHLLPQRLRHVMVIWTIVAVALTIAAFAYWYYGGHS